MLLLLLLGLDQEREKSRIAVDALLHVSGRSAASVARESGVDPSNLARFRKPDGTNQLSQDRQLDVLRALGWPDLQPDQDIVHRWFIEDDDGARAMVWLLSALLDGHSRISPTAVQEGKIAKAAAGTNEPTLWIGRLAPPGAFCSIVFKGKGAEFRNAINYLKTAAPHHGYPKAIGPLPARQAEALMRGKLDDGALRELVRYRRINDPATESLNQVHRQMKALGLTDEEHVQLLLEWLRGQVRANPEAVKTSLSNIDHLTLWGLDENPKAMTSVQKERLLDRILSTPNCRPPKGKT